MRAPDGEYVGLYSGDTPIAFYVDHINLTFFMGEEEPYVFDMENPLYGESVCGVDWTAYAFDYPEEEPMEILIHNPHCFGNETAIDELLSNLELWANIDFEKEVLASGSGRRNVGLLFMIVSLAILGIALFSTLIHMKNSKILWLFGLVILFAGTYFTYRAKGSPFWNESIVSNTILPGVAMILYMLFLSMVIVYFLRETKKTGFVGVLCLAVADGLFFVVPMVTELFFYDIFMYWVWVQALGNLLLCICIVKECFPWEGSEQLSLFHRSQAIGLRLLQLPANGKAGVLRGIYVPVQLGRKNLRTPLET